jgi:hypothetical protein
VTLEGEKRETSGNGTSTASLSGSGGIYLGSKTLTIDNGGNARGAVTQMAFARAIAPRCKALGFGVRLKV